MRTPRPSPRPRTVRPPRVVAAGAAIVLLLAGCGTDEPDEAAPTTSAATTSAPTPPSAPTTTSPPGTTTTDPAPTPGPPASESPTAAPTVPSPTTPAPTTPTPTPPEPSPPAPAPSPRTSPSPVTDLVDLWWGMDIEAFGTGRRVVALTFDGGASDSAVQDILGTLADEGVPATFFVTGQFARTYPDQVRSIAAAGHPVGNHSDTHPPSRWPRTRRSARS